MRVITRVHISDNLIIIFLGISLFLRWISWIALDRFLLSLPLISHVTLEKSLGLYAFLHFYHLYKGGYNAGKFDNNTRGDNDSCEESWGTEVDGPSVPNIPSAHSPSIWLMKRDSWETPGIAGTILEEPAMKGLRTIPSDISAGADREVLPGGITMLGPGYIWIREPDPWNFWPMSKAGSPAHFSNYVIEYTECLLSHKVVVKIK